MKSNILFLLFRKKRKKYLNKNCSNESRRNPARHTDSRAEP